MAEADAARNQTVDALRALAALSVCLFHFTLGQTHFQDVSLLRPLGGYGWLGVETFFVISGFIVPYSMARAGYSLAMWPSFLLKRLVRLEPPYLTSIAVVVALHVAASAMPGFKGQPIDWSLAQLLAHLGYLNAYIGLPWLNPVYWSLAIEFQYYLLIGLTLPALTSGSPASRIGLLASAAAVPLAMPNADGSLIIPYLPVFAAGILTFLLVARLIPAGSYWVALAALALLLAATRGGPVMLATIAPAVAMATLRLPRLGPIAWLGAISYSIYLLHVPVGGRVMNLASRLPATAGVEVLAVALAFAASILAAYGLYRLVERPAREFAAAIRYARAGTPSGQVAERV